NPEGKNVKQVDFTVLESSTGNQAMTLTEAEFFYNQSNVVEGIEFNGVPSEMFIGDIAEISAAVTPEDAPYLYYDITSSNPDKVEVIRVADGSGFKFYLKAKEATAEGETVILTATAGAKDAEGGDVTATAEITVNEGVNTAELQALIEKYNDLSKEVYTE